MMKLTIVTPEQQVFQGEVTEATFPGVDGSFQVLHNHAAIVSALGKGTVSYTTKEGKKSHLVEGGVVEVNDNKIVLLAEKVIG
jgi:F-type H+-transporting ATPase subunit epsilon